MALSQLTRRLVASKLATYCEQRCPPHLHDQVRLGYKIRGNSVTLYEARPAYHAPETWIDIVVAQFRLDPATQTWSLYCADRNSRWHRYTYLKPQESFEVLLEEVEADPTGIFWG